MKEHLILLAAQRKYFSTLLPLASKLLLAMQCMHQFIENAIEARPTNIIFVGKVSSPSFHKSQCSAVQKRKMNKNKNKRNAHQVPEIYACDEFYILHTSA